jgi:hypothetical protein
MKIRIAMLALCAGTFAIAQANVALAALDPIPGVDVIVKRHPAKGMIRVGDCQSGGGKIVKMRGEWVCTGLPASGDSAKLPRTGTGGKPSTVTPIVGVPVGLDHDPEGLKKGATGNDKR